MGRVVLGEQMIDPIVGVVQAMRGRPELPPGVDDPERNLAPREFGDLRGPRPLNRREMDIPLERGRLDADPEMIVEKLDESVNAVIGGIVALVNERILARDKARLGIVFGQCRDVGVVLP